MHNPEQRESRHFGRGRGPGNAEFGHDRRQFRRGGRHGHGPDFGPGFGPGPGFGRGRGRGGRGRRGDVRAAVLLLLAERPMHGYELIQRIRERSDDIWRPSPGSVYPALAQLEDEGLVLIEKLAGRKTAQLTDEGKAYVEQQREELGDPWAEVKEDVGAQALDLRGLVGQVMGAVGQVAAVGTPEQAAKAADVLTETRKALYRILAEDDAVPGEDPRPEN